MHIKLHVSKNKVMGKVWNTHCIPKSMQTLDSYTHRDVFHLRLSFTVSIEFCA